MSLSKLKELKEFRNFIKSWYPWKTEKQITTYLVLNTPWPQGSLEMWQAYVRTNVLSNWDAYVKEGDSEGFDITEPPTAKLKHLNPVDMHLADSFFVPVIAHREPTALKHGHLNTQKPFKKL